MRPWRSISSQITRPALTHRTIPFRPPFRRFNHNQTVYVRESYVSRNKVLLILVNGALAYTVVRLFFRKLDSAIDDVDIQEMIEEEGDEESMFVPLSWPKRMPQQYYHQSDEDWQEFIKFSNNAEKKKAIRDELANRVISDISKNAKTQQIFGKKIRLSKHWLEVKFPDAPPPEYARQGLEWADEYIAISTQVLPHSHFVTLNHVMRPRAAWVALQSSVKMFYMCQLIKVKAAIGISLDQHEQQAALLYRLVRDAQRGQLPQEDPLQSIAQSQNKAIDQLLGKGASKPPSTQTPQPAREPQPAPSMSTGLPSIISPQIWERINSTFNPFASASSASSSPSSINTADSSSTSNTDSKFNGWPLLPIEFPPSLIIAASTFQAALAKNWFNSRLDLQPKGSFLVFGEVEVIGERARAKCDVKAAYDPKEGKYIWVVVNVKHLWELKQRAKGGP